MHDFLAWIRCFVVRCSASRRSSRRCSLILRSAKRTKLFSISPRPNNRNFPFISCPPNQHKWIEFISASGCLRLVLLFKELKRLQIEMLPFEDPVAALLRSVPDHGPQGRGYNIGRGGAVTPSFNSREFERSLGVAARDDLMQKKAAGFGTLRLLLVLSRS